MNDLNFNCTKCGACCSEAPQLTLSESLDLSDKFFFQAAHFSILSYEKDPIHKDLVEHYTKFCHTFFLPEKNCHLYYFVVIKAVNRPSQKCPQLVGNLCSIQHKKPKLCRIAPLNPMVSEEAQINLFEAQWKPLIEQKRFMCDTSAAAPKIIAEGEISDFLIQEEFYHYLNDVRQMTTFYVKEVLKEEADLKAHIGYCFDTAQKTKSSVFYTSAIELLKNYYNLSVLDEHSIHRFAENQKNFIQTDVNFSLAQKHLNDRDITKLMRAEMQIIENHKMDMENMEENDEIRFM